MDGALLLFDIDGTLLSGATRAHREALHLALNAVHHIDAAALRKPISPAGRTDGEIARLLLLQAGISAERIDARAAAVKEHCCRNFVQMDAGDLRRTVLAGIPPLLEWLAGTSNVRLGLLTGNFEPVGRRKLTLAGLGGWFTGCPGGFGSDSEDRAALPAIARRRAGTVGVPHPREQTIVIGDTPRDIACARADDVRCVAVATGPHPVEELSAADAVAADARALRGVLEDQLAG